MKTLKTLFSGLDEKDRNNILDQCSRRSVRRRAVIVRQGGSGRDMYFVLSGRLKVSVVSDTGKEISFVVLSENDYFGELSLIDAQTRSATVTAVEDSELLVLGHASYQQLMQQHPQTAIKFLTHMLSTLSRRLRATDELYQDSVFLEVAARLAKFLLNTSVAENDSALPQQQIDIRLSQYELGTLVNASRESVNKQLRDWESRGIVSLQRGRIVLLNPAHLQKEAEGW